MSFIVCLNHCKSNWKSKQKLNTKSICEMSIMLCTVTFSALQRDSCQRASVSVRITWLYRFRSLTRHELCLSELVTFMSVLPGARQVAHDTTQHSMLCCHYHQQFNSPCERHKTSELWVRLTFMSRQQQSIRVVGGANSSEGRTNEIHWSIIARHGPVIDDETSSAT